MGVGRLQNRHLNAGIGVLVLMDAFKTPYSQHYYMVSYGKNCGTLDHGLGRNDEELFECAK